MTHQSQPLVLISQFLTIFKQSFEELKPMKYTNSFDEIDSIIYDFRD